MQEWQFKHPGSDPIYKQEIAALTPLVFVMWEDRHKEFPPQLDPN